MKSSHESQESELRPALSPAHAEVSAQPLGSSVPSLLGHDGATLLPAHTGPDGMATLWGAESASLRVKAGSKPCQLCGLGQVVTMFPDSPLTDTARKTGASCSGCHGELNGFMPAKHSGQNRDPSALHVHG